MEFLLKNCARQKIKGMISSEPWRGGTEDVNKEFYMKNKDILNEGKT